MKVVAFRVQARDNVWACACDSVVTGTVSCVCTHLLRGLVESAAPGQYDWSLYKMLIHAVTRMGFKVKVRCALTCMCNSAI